uniref:RNA-directed RNA polymerase n=1 Tax=Erysiphales associated totivirus 5 TaxID=2719857 RepID=A0A6G9ENP0_9VIRU|nr:RNA-dependent RNA polymerase [Erysiphales associated totivirus 5]
MNLAQFASVPLALKSAGKSLSVSSEAEGDWLLYDMISGTSVKGRHWLHVEGAAQVVEAVYFKKLHVTGFYISNTADFTTMLPSARRRISRIEFGPTLMPYGAITAQEVLESVVGSRFEVRGDRESDKRLERVKTWFRDGALPHPAASQRHMRHLSVNELSIRPWEFWLQKARPAMLMMAEIQLRGNEVTEAFFVGVLIWLAALAPEQHALAQGWKIWRPKELTMSGWASSYKNNVTTKLKALQNNVACDLTPLFEAEVLVNRGIGKVDWTEERLHRIKPKLARFEPSALYASIRNIFETARAAGGKPSQTTWQSYWENRWTWAPVGSCHSQYEEDNRYMGQKIEQRTKFYSLNCMPKMPLEHFMDRRPEIRAWPSVKYEWGKQRAIYGVDLTSFVLTGFAMLSCEEALSPIFPLGRSAQAGSVKKFVNETLRNGVPYCFDFEDFNTQHSTSAMQSVVRAYREVFSDMLSVEQLSAIDWTIDSIATTRVMPNVALGTTSYDTNGTLMSGWRLTTLANTVLNAAYIDLITGGRLPASVHNGDDVLAAVRNYSQVQAIHQGATVHGVRYQKTKCSLGATAEFLRVDHSTGSGSQYLARAVATMVHGPVDMSDPYSAKQQIQAFNARAAEVCERGANVELIRDLRLSQYQFLRNQGRLEGIQVDPYYLHVTKGGTSLEDKLEAIQYELISVDVAGDDEGAQTSRILPGVWDYARMVSRKFGIPSYEKTIRQKAQQAIDATSGTKKTIARLEKTNATQFDVQRLGLYKLYRSTMLGMKANMAKAFGIPVWSFNDEDTRLEDFVKGCRDPLKALRLLV